MGLSAEGWESRAREYAQKVATHRKNLASGKSQDPAADREALAEAARNRRICELNAEDCRGK